MLHLAKRDLIATCAVGAAVALYVLWIVDRTLPGMSSARATGLAILGLGVLASASAVVPGFTQLLHGNKAYLAGTSLLGLVALVAGIVTLWSAGSTALAVLMGALVVLWLASTTHHLMLSRRSGGPVLHVVDLTEGGDRHRGHAA
jgi:hypothetical protein